MHLFLIISWVWRLIFQFDLMTESSGDCKFAENLVMEKQCTGKVSREIRLRWSDSLAPMNTHYEIWTPSSDDSVVLVTFMKTKLSKTNGIVMACLMNKTSNCEFKFPKSSIHCFDHSLGYLEDLRANCLGVDYDVSKTVRKPIIFYARPKTSLSIDMNLIL